MQFCLIRVSRNFTKRVRLKKDHKTTFHDLKTPNIAFFVYTKIHISTDSIQTKMNICLNLHDHKLYI